MAKLRITYRDGSPDSELTIGAFAQIAAKRRYGIAAVRDGAEQDPEAGLFAAFVEVKGPQVAADPPAFDKWLQTVDSMSAIDEDNPADPPPAETSPPTWPDSPPTSD